MRRALVLAMLAACSVEPVDYTPITRTTVVELPATLNRDLDILMVVDDSPGIADKQTNLANNLPNLINVLNLVQDGLPNVHIGVITTDLGTKTTQDGTPAPMVGTPGQGGCASTGKGGDLQMLSSQVTGTFVSDIRIPSDGTRQTNYTGALADRLAEMVAVGQVGCGFEQPLAAIRAAVSNNSANANFLRPTANLAILILTDEDDCSAHSNMFFDTTMTAALGPVASFRCTRFGVICDDGGTNPDEMNASGVKSSCHASMGSQLVDDVGLYHDLIVGLKGDPNKVVVGVIAGAIDPFDVETTNPGSGPQQTLQHSCNFVGPMGTDTADPPARLQSFVDLFPDRGQMTSICQPDLTDPLVKIGNQIVQMIGSPCVTVALTDVDKDTPGDQFDCEVTDDLHGAETTIPFCDGTAQPCFHLDPDPVTCPLLEHLKLVVDRPAMPDAATITKMQCRTD